MSTALTPDASTLRNIKPQGFLDGIALLTSATKANATGAEELTWGTGAPDHTAAAGSAYVRLDAANSGTMFYRNTDGATTWEAAGVQSADSMVLVTVAAADAAGGATDSALTVTLTHLDGSALTSARTVALVMNTVQYMGAGATNAGLSLADTTGSSAVVVAGAYWLVTTDATGAYVGTLTNTADEGPLYFAAASALGGMATPANGCVVIGSNSDAATWSA